MLDGCTVDGWVSFKESYTENDLEFKVIMRDILGRKSSITLMITSGE